MAIGDVKKCYESVQAEYFEMKKMLDLLVVEVKEGRLTIEQFNNYKEQVAPIETNYERFAYVMFLLQKPNKKSKKAKEYKQNKEYYDYFTETGNDFDAMSKENKDILKEIRRKIDETKNS